MELFVFPLGQILLYPSFSKPFHIHEERYIQMVEDAVRLGVPIAIGNVVEASTQNEMRYEYKYGEKLSFVKEIVGYGRAVIVERSIDGSILVFLEGLGKARLGRVLDRQTPYIVCEAEPLIENHLVENQNINAFVVAHRVLIQWMNQHIADRNARDQFLKYVRTPEQIIGCYASYLLADHDMQQLILEINDINDKIKIIHRLIASGELVA